MKGRDRRADVAFGAILMLSTWFMGIVIWACGQIEEYPITHIIVYLLLLLVFLFGTYLVKGE